jgi:putative phosphoesterase
VKILVMSDSHDNWSKLEAAAESIATAEAVIHCGDICSPFMVRRLGELAGDRPVAIVWGNNDGDPLLISRVAADFPSITLHGPLAEVELGGLRVAVNHYPQIARGLARSGDYDLVCYGHDHQRNQALEGKCLLINPGELMGMKGPSTMALVETSPRQVSWVELP